MGADVIEIREPRPCDVDAWTAMFHETHAQATEESAAFDEAASRMVAEGYCGRQGRPDRRVLTAFVAGEAIGWIQASVDSPHTGGHAWLICGVETRPSRRRRGVGRRLLAAIVEMARCEGRAVYAAVRDENRPSIGLFEACGFARTDELEGFSADVTVFRSAAAPGPREERNR